MFETIREILALQLDIDKNIITEDTDIIEDLGADSLDLAELMTSLEEEYGFIVTSDEVHDIRTLTQVEEYIRKHAPHLDN